MQTVSSGSVVQPLLLKANSDEVYHLQNDFWHMYIQNFETK